MAETWTVLAETELLRRGARLVVSEQTVRLPDGREVPGYLRLSTPSFVCILARLEDGRIICERQYKHGAGRVILTLPAGAMDEGEAPLHAAQRELLEETGYESADWTALGTSVTHANAGGSTCYMFLARGCRKVAEPNSGDLETMTIELVPPAALLQAMRAGEMPLSSDPGTVLHGLIAEGLL
jgi:ADP-ribose pyrophosphatase